MVRLKPDQPDRLLRLCRKESCIILPSGWCLEDVYIYTSSGSSTCIRTSILEHWLQYLLMTYVNSESASCTAADRKGGLWYICMPLHCLQVETTQQNYNSSRRDIRDHLLQCSKKKQLTAFPHTILTKRRKQDAFPYHEIEVFCDCNMPEVYDDMVQCEECKDWFHMHCVGLKSPPPESETWQCSKCTSS